jgi:hypothetical protein
MDVDIDFRTDFDPLKYFPEAVRASRVQNGELKPHTAGIYFQQMARDVLTGLAAIPYEQAQELGYFKIDFLHLSFLDNFESKGEIRALLKKEPDWTLLQSPEAVVKLFQLHKHFDLVAQVRPTSVQELADCIALIRPSKVKLINNYIQAKRNGGLYEFRKVLYQKPTDGRAYYKKPHSVAYALTIVLQLHLIKAGIM